MATKLRLWQMTQYERIMYLDADTVLTGPVDATFKSANPNSNPNPGVRGFAAEKALHHTHFNAGVMLLTPSEQVHYLRRAPRLCLPYISHMSPTYLLCISPIFSPVSQTFAELLALGAAPHTRLFGNVIDCTEQVHPSPQPQPSLTLTQPLTLALPLTLTLPLPLTRACSTPTTTARPAAR